MLVSLLWACAIVGAVAMPVLTYDGNLCADLVCNIATGLNSFKLSLNPGVLTRVDPPDIDDGTDPSIYKWVTENPVLDSNGHYIKMEHEICTNALKLSIIAGNRKLNCPQGTCNTQHTGLSCDEFPFASSYEGGFGASSWCVPAWQNVMGGGGNLNAFYTANNIIDKSEFKVKVINVPALCNAGGLPLMPIPQAGQTTCFTSSSF